MIITNKFNLPNVLQRVTEKNHESRFFNTKISVTQLIQPPQQLQLQKRYWDKITTDVMDSFFALFGSSVHEVLNIKPSGSELIETRFICRAPELPYALTGQIDYYNRGVLSDFKVTSAWSLIHGLKLEWEQQVNLYRYLLTYNDNHVDHTQIVVILRDWSKMQAIKSTQYPQQPIELIPVPMWDSHRTQRVLLDRMRSHKYASELPDAELPPCNEFERWAKENKWCVYKVIPDSKMTPEKTAQRAAKLCYSKEEAEAFCIWKCNKTKIKHIVVFREGEQTRCQRYCNVAPYCHQYRGLK